MVIISNVLILAFSYPIDNNPDYASLKEWLQIIGLKANVLDIALTHGKNPEDLTETEKVEVETEALRGRMIAMVIFFLCSIYLCKHFSQKMK